MSLTVTKYSVIVRGLVGLELLEFVGVSCQYRQKTPSFFGKVLILCALMPINGDVV